MSAPTCSLEDIRDVEGFAAAVARRMARNWTPDEIEEATAEGVVLLHELHEMWEPAKCASFYSFCSTYLPLRLISWWRKEARQRLLAHGNHGAYTYHQRVSLDEYLESDDSYLTESGESDAGTDRALVTEDVNRVGD